MDEKTDAHAPAPGDYTPPAEQTASDGAEGADRAGLAAATQEHPEYFKPRPDEELTVTPGTNMTTGDRSPQPSNKNGAVWISLLGSITFALLYLLATILYSWAAYSWGDQVGGRDLFSYLQLRTLNYVSTPAYWLTTLAFFGYFLVLALLFYGSKWRAYVFGALVVAILTYVTAIGAGLLTVSAWTLTFREAIALLWRGIAFNPLILVTLILAREVPIWFGGWIAVRARKIAEKSSLNSE